MEQTDHLWPGGPVFYYDDRLFKPSTDAFLLGAFAKPRPGDTICDLGAGTGLIGLTLLARNPTLTLHNVEIQEAPLRLAERTFRENGFTAGHHLADLRQLEAVLPAGCCDYVVSNPPYFTPGCGCPPPDSARRIARQADICSLAELCASAARLLRWGGRFALVYRPEQLCSLLESLRKNVIEPKRLRLVQHKATAAPSLVLIEARRGGRPGLVVEPPLILRHSDGRETDEAAAAYFRSHTAIQEGES